MIFIQTKRKNMVKFSSIDKSNNVCKTCKKDTKLDKLSLGNNSKSNEIDKDIEVVTCPICYEDIKENNYIITKCNHKFCNDCLFKSLDVKSDCPICRQELFNFKKVKDLTRVDLANLEVSTIPTRIITIRYLVDSLVEIIFNVFNNEIEDYISTEHENSNFDMEIVNNCITNISFRSKISGIFYEIITSTIRGLSYMNYYAVYDWLKK